jgi:hypothetical protein
VFRLEHQIQDLLTRVFGLSEKYDAINQKTGAFFNIFEITKVSKKELVMCRVIKELLDPKGSHFQGDIYLKLFIKHVLEMDEKITEKDLKKISVRKEFTIEGKRKIDLVIHSPKFFIPIEVKIYADDQPAQCFDYLKRAKNSSLYYLTLYGHEPKDKSTSGLSEEEIHEHIKCISFQNHIIRWLEKCLEHKETISISPIREIIFQFITTIKRLTGQFEEGYEMELKSLIMGSSRNFKSALQIESIAKSCKIEMLKKFFRAIENEMSDRQKVKLDTLKQYDYYESTRSNVFYNNELKQESECPGLSYMFHEDVEPGKHLIFRIELDQELIAGIVVCNQEWTVKKATSIIGLDKLKNLVPDPSLLLDYHWWVVRETISDDDNFINFKAPYNDRYFDLYDSKIFDEIVSDCMKKIEDLWPGLKRQTE